MFDCGCRRFGLWMSFPTGQIIFPPKRVEGLQQGSSLSGSIFLTSGPFAALAQTLKPEGSCPSCVLGDKQDQGGREMDGPRALGQEVQRVLGPRRVPPRPHLLSIPVSPAGR